jgi:hypothetical protein
MRFVLLATLFAHAVAHLPGFLVNWQLRSFAELPYRTTILGGLVDVGAGGTRAVGLAWLALSLALSVVGIAVLMRPPWWLAFAYTTVAVSVALCVVGWPDTRFGLVANAFILALIYLSARSQ